MEGARKATEGGVDSRGRVRALEFTFQMFFEVIRHLDGTGASR